MSELAPNRQLLVDLGYEEAVIFDNPDYDAAIIGVSSDDRVIYDYDLMIECLMIDEGMSMEDAIDFIDYNTLRALPYAGSDGPIVMYKLDF